MKMTSGILLIAMLLASVAEGKGIDPVASSITVAIANEPPTMNSSQIADGTSNFVVGHLMDGLTRYGRRGRVVPGIAISWERIDNRYLFKLRRTNWTNGKPVTAHDFVFAWRLGVSPATASPFSSGFHIIENAREILAGEMSPDQLGVTALDDYTLEVRLNQPVLYFPETVTASNFLPINEAFYLSQADRYAAEPQHLITNGPFKLTKWIHGASLTLEKNTDYWDVGKVSLNTIEIGYITPDTSTQLNLFRDGQIATAVLDDVTVKTAAESGLKISSYSPGSTQLMIINTSEGRPTADAELRRALAAALDKGRIVNSVLALPGNQVTHSIFPGWNSLVADHFDTDNPLASDSYDLTRAKALVKQYRERFGDVPPLTLLTVTNPTLMKLSEYMQGVYKRELGIDIKIDAQNIKQWLARAFKADFDVTVISYGPLLGDPSDPGALYTSASDSNLGRFSHPEYDRLFDLFNSSVDTADRLHKLKQMQQILADQVPVVPLFENASVYVQDHRLKGVQRERLGISPNYSRARIVK